MLIKKNRAYVFKPRITIFFLLFFKVFENNQNIQTYECKEKRYHFLMIKCAFCAKSFIYESTMLHHTKVAHMQRSTSVIILPRRHLTNEV